MPLIINNLQDIESARNRILHSAERAKIAICGATLEPLDWLREIKFKTFGFHPYDHHPLNFIEQINQTFTYIVALEATRVLLTLHPGSGYKLAPGAHAEQTLDIMSIDDGLVGAECFSSVDPRNNSKLKKDVAKLKNNKEKYRYVFLTSPKYPLTKHLTALDVEGIEVWSVAI